MKHRIRETPAPPSGIASVTIHDVAREAQVSIATVSRVLNGHGTVRGKNLEKVKAAFERLQYVPHGGAQSLVRRETRTLGVLLPDMHGEFFSEVIRGIDQVTRQRRYSLLVTSTHGDSRSAEAMLRTLHGKVDGLIVLCSDPEMYRAVRGLVVRTPVVFLNHLAEEAPGGLGQATPGPEAPSLDTLSVDNQGGAFTMTRYLMGLGHRHIAFVKGPEGNGDAAERLLGYREAMSAPGEEGLAAVELPGDFTEEGGFGAGRRVLALEPRPTAIFAANDTMAIGVYRALREQGIRIPAEVSVAGFDDVPFVRYLDPPLTTIHVPISDLGAGAARRLLDRLEADGDPTPRQQSLEVLLVARGSAGRPEVQAPVPGAPGPAPVPGPPPLRPSQGDAIEPPPPPSHPNPSSSRRKLR
jgi:LacI family transcriptional regulator